MIRDLGLKTPERFAFDQLADVLETPLLVDGTGGALNLVGHAHLKAAPALVEAFANLLGQLFRRENSDVRFRARF